MSALTVNPNDPAYLRIAFSKLGVSEIAGRRHEKQILDMFEAAGHDHINDDETPWCAAFVAWCLHEAGLPHTGSLLARSYMTQKYGTRLNISDFNVPRGAIAVWTRTGGNHVNFVLDDDGEVLTCIGGNQAKKGTNGAVTISRRRKADGLLYACLPPTKSAKPKAKPVPKVIVPPPERQPDDPGPEVEVTPEVIPAPNPEPNVPWWKQPFVWLGTLVTGGALGGVQLTVDAQFLWGASAFVAIVALLFAAWVYGPKPRGKFFKGVFK